MVPAMTRIYYINVLFSHIVEFELIVKTFANFKGITYLCKVIKIITAKASLNHFLSVWDSVMLMRYLHLRLSFT